MFRSKMSQFIWIAALTLSLSAPAMKLARADGDDAGATVSSPSSESAMSGESTSPTEADTSGDGDEGSRPGRGGGGGGSSYRGGGGGGGSSYRGSSPRSGGSTTTTTRSGQPRQTVDLGRYEARTNPDGSHQYRDKQTGRDVKNSVAEGNLGVKGRVNPSNGGMQFNNGNRDVSARQVRKSQTYGGRPISDYRPTTVGGQSWNNYRSTTINNYHYDNSINYHGGYRSGMGYGYSMGGAWYGYHPLLVGGRYGYYDVYGGWNLITDAAYLALLVNQLNTPVTGVTYVSTSSGQNYVAQGQLVTDVPFDETKIVETDTTTTTTGTDGNGNPTQTTTNTSTTTSTAPTKTSSDWF